MHPSPYEDIPYEDILYLPRPASKHPPMPRENRAAQFAPFAALHGHEDAIDETARLTDRKIELDDTQKERIDRILRQAAADTTLCLRLICYEADPLKEGGRYVTVTGHVKRIDEITRRILFSEGTTVLIEHVTDASFTV